MRLTCTLVAAALLGLASDASALTTVTLSSVSSDATPAGQLDATLDFDITGAAELTLTLTNTGSDGFNINQVYFNGSGIVSSLSLTSATHSVAGVVTAAWGPVETGSTADGFGAFDFALTDGVGETNPNVLEDGESIVFVLVITGSGGYTDADFIVGNSMGYLAAAKFVNGPDDPESPGDEDSAFGTTDTVPEPATSLLLSLGLAGLLYVGRRRA
jgi:hypothetical protein